MIDHTTQFPHCDARVLHAPGECEYCDRHPDWQDLRKIWMVAFTSHEPETSEHAGTQVPCPADFNRPPDSGSDHRRWAGNVATSAKPVNETFSSQIFYGGWTDLGDDFEIVEEPVTQATAGPPPLHKPVWLSFRRRSR